MHRCPNPACPAKGYEWLKHFVSRGAMDIDGVGERLIRRLLDEGMIASPQDLYRLTVEELLAWTASSSVGDNVIAAIEASSERPLGRRAVRARDSARRARHRRRLLADHFGSVDALAAPPEPRRSRRSRASAR